MGAATLKSYARNSVIIGPSGSAWPFAPRRQPGALFFDYDPNSSEVVWNSGNSRDVLGMPESAILPHGALFLAHLHESDRYRTLAMLESALRGESPYVATYRWVRPDTNEVRVLHCRAMLEADHSLMRGFVLDMTADAPLLQFNCDYLSSIGFSFEQIGSIAITLDLEARIRSVHRSSDASCLSFGFPDLNPLLIQPGQLLPACFESQASQDEINRLITRALAEDGRNIAREWEGYTANFKVIKINDVAQGIAVIVSDVRDVQQLRRTVTLLEARNRQIEHAATTASALLDRSQEIVGLAALIGRNAAGNPLLRHTAEALLVSTREIGALAREMMQEGDSHISRPRGHPSSTRGNGDGVHDDRRATTALGSSLTGGRASVAHVMFSAPEARIGRTFTALLQDAGITCVAAPLGESELRDALLQHTHIRIVILDIAHDTSHGAMTIRRLRKFFPALQFISLVPGPAGDYDDLQRAGCNLIMAKPVGAREIEGVVRAMLNLAAITARATQPR